MAPSVIPDFFFIFFVCVLKGKAQKCDPQDKNDSITKQGGGAEQLISLHLLSPQHIHGVHGLYHV